MKTGLAKSVWYFVTFLFLFILAAGLIGTPPARGHDADPLAFNYSNGTFTQPDGPAAGWTPVSGTWGVENGEYSGSIDPSLTGNTFITGTDGLSDYKVEVSISPKGPDHSMAWRAGLLVRANLHPGSNGYDGYLFNSYGDGLRIYKLVNDEVVELIYGGYVIIHTNAWHTLGVESKGNELKFYYNGTLIYSYIDNSVGGYPPFSSGMIGLRVWSDIGPTHVHFDNFNYCGIDTFAEPDGSAAGWTPVSGTWGVENGEYSGSIGPGLMANTFITGTGGLNDYKVEVSVFPIGPDDEMGWRAGLLVRAKAHPGGNGYDGYLIHSYREGLRIYKLVNDEVVEWIYGEGSYIPADAWHTLGVEAKGNELKFYYNGTLKYDYIDNSVGGYPAFSSGMIGLRTWGHSGPPHVHFDNLKYCGPTITKAVLAINCGGPEYMHPKGILFQADTLFTGGSAYTTTATIAGVEDLEYGLPYQSERYGNFSYKIPLPNGNYNVILGFAEIYPYIFGGAREFDVIIQGKRVLMGFDLFAWAGKNKPFEVPVYVNVTDGVLDIEFYSERGNAKVNFIVITPPQALPQQDVVFAVNCGGPEYTDKTGIVYQADTHYFSRGRTYTTAAMIEGTEDDLLYQSERYGNFSYYIRVENGDYRVTLRFAEIYSYAHVGGRVFNVAIEGKTVVSDLDLFALKGKNNSYDYTIPFPISITDGWLDIEFYNADGTAKVSAILVTKNKE